MKIALVTGGTRGIGFAVAQAFFERGYVVFVTYSSDEASAEQARACGFQVRKADASSESELRALFGELPRLDVLVNNAGVSVVKPVQDTSLEEWNRMVAVNQTGVFLCSKFAVEKMLGRGGAIVNVSSVWGEVGASCEVGYSATKAAVIGLTKALAKEVGESGIRVNCVTPGVIDTSMNAHLSAEERAELLAEIPVGRFGTGKDVAEAVVFLAEQSYLQGVILPVNGGYQIS